MSIKTYENSVRKLNVFAGILALCTTIFALPAIIAVVFTYYNSGHVYHNYGNMYHNFGRVY